MKNDSEATNPLTPSVWTDRCVHFTSVPRATEAVWEAFFEALSEHYWERPEWIRRWLEPCISSCNRVVTVGGLPWWMPKWWARRTVVNIAIAHGLGGHATYEIERVSLP